MDFFQSHRSIAVFFQLSPFHSTLLLILLILDVNNSMDIFLQKYHDLQTALVKESGKEEIN